MPDFGPVPSTDGGETAPVGAGALGGAAGASLGKQVGEAEKQSSALLDSAKGGGFRVSENAAQPLREALIEAQEDFKRIMEEAWVLAEEPKLGTGPYAERVAQHVRQSGDGDQGVLPILKQLRSIINQSEEALKIAMGNYNAAEEEQKQTFNQ